MIVNAQELQKIRGIGAVLAGRLLDEGYDSFAKIVHLGEDGLKSIKGINPKAVPAILAQAANLAESEESERDVRIKALMDSVEELRNTVQVLTTYARERFAEKMSGKPGRKLTEDLVQFIDALEQIESNIGKRIKKTGKGLCKAEQRLEGLAEAGLKTLRKGIKRSRKALQRVHA